MDSSVRKLLFPSNDHYHRVSPSNLEMTGLQQQPSHTGRGKMSGFGWSVGDIVLAGKFIAKVVKALKETGGARGDYQQSIEFLLGLENTLQNLVTVGSVLPPDAAARIALQQTEHIANVLIPLLKDVKKFESSIGESASQGPGRKIGSKLKWSLHQAKKVEKLEDKIAVPLATINTNLGVQIVYVNVRLIGGTLYLLTFEPEGT